MDKSRAIIDYATQDNATGMRDAMYTALQDRVMAHIEAKKQEIALNLISNPNNPKEAEVEDEAITH